MQRVAFALAALMLGAGPSAFGQNQAVEADGIRVFQPVYFQEFDPLTALDMVNRLPGVNPQETDGGRGLSGVRSNLLINGERPPPKGKSASEQLDEMPVSGVIAIELVDAGARLDLDMQGYPQVINVITLEDRPAYYEIVTQIQRAGSGDIDQQNQREYQLDGTGSFSWRAHEFTITGNAQENSSRSPAEFVAIDPANPEQRISSLNTSEGEDEAIEFDAIFSLPSESTLSFNSRLTWDLQGSMPLSLGVDEDLQGIIESSDGEDDLRDFSAEYRRPIATSGELMLAFVDTTSTDRSESIFQDATLSRFSVSESETGETATRLFMTNAPTDRLTVRTNVSNAYNYFEGGFQIFENGAEIIVDGSNSRVQEDRRSLEGSVDWVLTPRWTLRGALGVESYSIDTRDISSGTQTDPRGEISASFRPQPRTTFTFTMDRTVGQLDFNQFLASSSLSSEILTAGAATLEPERDRGISASYDRRFGDRGVLRFSLSRVETENPVNSVALSDSVIVSQNTSSETVDSLQISVDLPMERFGHEDIILSIGSRFTDSETIDPITGEVREVSGGFNGGGGGFNGGGGGGGFNGGGGGFNGGGRGFSPNHFKQVQLRKDPGDGKWSWSVSARDIQPPRNYSARQIFRSSGERQWDASATWEPRDGLRFRVNVEGPRTQTRDASFFPAVREIGLDPSFLSGRVNKRGRLASVSIEWRSERFEVTGTLTSRPNVITEEALTPFGETLGTLLTREVARSPRAMLRFRIIGS